MIGRTLFLAGLFLGSITATPVASPAAVEVAGARSVNVAGATEYDAPALGLRNVDLNDVIDTVAGWGKEYVATHDLIAAGGQSIHRRDLNTTEIIDTIVAWIKNWMGDSDESSGNAGANNTAVQRRALASDEVVDQIANWTKVYFRSVSKRVAARDEHFNRNVDHIAEKVKRSMKSTGATFDGPTTLSILSQIIDAAIKLTEELFGTNDLGAIISDVIAFLAQFT